MRDVSVGDVIAGNSLGRLALLKRLAQEGGILIRFSLRTRPNGDPRGFTCEHVPTLGGSQSPTLSVYSSGPGAGGESTHSSLVMISAHLTRTLAAFSRYPMAWVDVGSISKMIRISPGRA